VAFSAASILGGLEADRLRASGLRLEFAPASLSLTPDLLCNLLAPPKFDHLVVTEQASVHLAYSNPIFSLKRKSNGRGLAEAVQGFVVDILVLLVSHRVFTLAYRIVFPGSNQNWDFCQGLLN
jgi:hypothetical protein